MKKLQVWLLLFATTNAFGQLSVMSYNIRYDTAADSLNAWAYRKADLVSFLQFHHPQIIGLQEALHHQIQYIDSALTQYSFVGVGRDDGAQLGEFSPILYDSSRLYMIRSGTFWLSETPEKPSQGWDAALPRICTWAIFEKKNEHQQFLCMNAHFDHLGERARLESSILIAHRLAEISDEQNWPVIVMGDMNATPESPALQYWNNILMDTYHSNQHRGPSGTFNGFAFPAQQATRIDYILTRNFQVLEHAHLIPFTSTFRQLSDHWPVWALLAF